MTSRYDISKSKCSWISSLSLLVMALVISAYLQSIPVIQTQSLSLSKINEINLDDHMIQRAGSAASHYRNSFRTKLPVFNVSGLLSIYSIEGLDHMICNRTYRMLMNQWFLDECIEGLKLTCGRSGRSKRNSLSSYSSAYDPILKEYYSSPKYSSPPSQSSTFDDSIELMTMMMETGAEDHQQQREQEQEQKEAFEVFRRSPVSGSSIIHKRNQNYRRYTYSEQAHQAQILMDKCCRESDCAESYLREQFQGICAPNLVRTKVVFDS